jgi:hypothetical protein
METVISTTIRDLLPKRRGRFNKKEDEVDSIKQIQADLVAQQTVDTKHKVMRRKGRGGRVNMKSKESLRCNGAFFHPGLS